MSECNFKTKYQMPQIYVGQNTEWNSQVMLVKGIVVPIPGGGGGVLEQELGILNHSKW